VQCFNELLVQYPIPGKDPERPGQIVPDNRVVIHAAPIVADGSYMTPLQPVDPFLVLEYVSRSSKRKYYEISKENYERELKVPYYLIFYPEKGELSLFHLREDSYHPLHPDRAGRRAIPELELEVALLDGWVRYWFRGSLLPLPGDLLIELSKPRDRLAATESKLVKSGTELTAAKSELTHTRSEQERVARASLEAELARMKAELARLRRWNSYFIRALRTLPIPIKQSSAVPTKSANVRQAPGSSESVGSALTRSGGGVASRLRGMVSPVTSVVR
jgi:hypothetical protein